MAVYSFSQGNTTDPTLDAIAVELEAMQVIARALGGVRDPQIRQRVLQWANERFNLAPTPQPPARRTVAAEKVDENGLDVEPLYDFFDAPRPSAQSHDSLYDFFEHPRAATLSAAPHAALAIIEPAPAPAVAPVRELRAVPDAGEPREEAALDTMVKGFASELQRLAIEWQTA